MKEKKRFLRIYWFAMIAGGINTLGALYLGNFHSFIGWSLACGMVEAIRQIALEVENFKNPGE